jgi:hypothetical protein
MRFFFQHNSETAHIAKGLKAASTNFSKSHKDDDIKVTTTGAVSKIHTHENSNNY